MSDDQVYSLTQQGIELMLNVLTKAALKGLITINCITEANVDDYAQTLADQDDIWEGTIISEREQKLALLFLVLPTLIVPSQPTEYN